MKELSPTTINIYHSMLATLSKNEIDFGNFEKLKHYLVKMKVRSAMVYLRAVIWQGKKNDTEMAQFDAYYQELRREDVKTRNEVKLDATYEDLVTVANYYKGATVIKKMRKFIVAQCYLELPIRNDLVELKIKNYDTAVDNYYVDGTITLNHYKTSTIYGTQIYAISSELRTAIDTYISKSAGLRKCNYLFYGNDGGLISKPTFLASLRKLYKDVIGKQLSFTQIRKIKITREHEGNTDSMDIAMKYMHSMDTEHKHYKAGGVPPP